MMSLLAVAGLSAARGISARENPATHRQRLLVLPFDLYDYSLDRRPVTVVPLRRWAAGLAGQLAADLRQESSFRVLRGTDVTAALRKVGADYRHPTDCRACMISIAKRAGADIVVIGQVRKLSNLITFFDVQLDDVHTGRVLHVISMRADGADSNAMWRNIARNIAGDVDRVTAHGR